MGIRRGSISTPIIADGLVLNMDAANKASYIPYATSAYNTASGSLTPVGSLVNDVGFLQPPVSASSWDFDGIDDRIDCGVWTPLNGASGCTISFWIKSGIDASNAYIIARAESTPQFMIFQKATNNYIWYRLYTGTNYTVQGGAVLDNEWHNCILVYNGSTLEIFEDGVSIDSTSVTGTLPVSTSPLRVASYAGGAPFKSGLISNIHIYNRGLTSNEVLHNYNALKGRFT